MKVITISGKAQSGKDTTAIYLKDELEELGYTVLICHYADLLKYICTQFFDWNGVKDTAGRTLLQRVGTDVVRAKYPNFWVDFLLDIFRLFPDDWDYVIIADTRFPNEIEEVKKCYDTTSIIVYRPNYYNELTSAQQSHISETALDNYKFDVSLYNDTDGLEHFRHSIQSIVDSIVK